MAGRPPGPDDERKKTPPVVGLRDSDLRPAFRALQTAYIHLLQNPFYRPDDRPPMVQANTAGTSAQITSAKFVNEVKRIGNVWAPGVANI